MEKVSREIQQTERRRSERRPYNAVVHYCIGGSEFVNVATSVSAEGVFIKNFTPPPLGTEVKIRLQVPGEENGRVYLIGRVVRVVDDVGREDRGIGVEFTSLEADSIELVQKLVKELFGTNDLGEILAPSSSGSFNFLPHPHDTMRMKEGSYQPLPASFGQYRILKALLLVLVGMLLGGWMFFLIFLAS